MIALLWFVLNVLVSPFKSKSRLEAENAALRHQVVVLRRIAVHRRVRLTNSDRMFFIRASGRLSLLLALEVSIPGRASAD